MSKYNNEILDSIYERYSKFNNENTLSLKESKDEYVLMMKKGAKIHIKKENRGKFSASAKRAGEGVQEHAHKVMNDPNATTLQKKRANFARNAAKWKHAKGGVIKSLENFDAQSFRKWLDKNYGQPN